MKCFKCKNEGSDFFGYLVCEPCKKRLRLHSNDTIEKNAHNLNVYTPHESYLCDIESRLKQLDQDYISKKLKLLHIKNQLEEYLD